MEFCIENKTLIGIKNTTKEESCMIIPSGIEIIAARVFESSDFQRIIISEGVETIENEAFSSCPNLETVVIPTTCKKIGKKAFYDCKALKDVFLNTANCSISSDAFSVIAQRTYDNFAFIQSESKPEYNIEERFPLTFHCVPNCSQSTMAQIVEASNYYCWITDYGARDNSYDVFMYGFHHGQSLVESGKRNIFINNTSIINDCVFPDKESRFHYLFGKYQLNLAEGNEEHLVISYNKIESEKAQELKSKMNDELDLEKLLEKIDSELKKLEEMKDKKEIIPSSSRKKGTIIDNTLFIPYGVITIEKEDYSDCADVTRIVFPDTVMVISDGSFSGFDKLKSVEFVSKPLYISENAFGETVLYYCIKNILRGYYDKDALSFLKEAKTDLTHRTLSDIWGIHAVENEYVTSSEIDGVIYLFEKESKKIVLSICDNTTMETIHVPDYINGEQVCIIGPGAFSGLKQIKEIDIPSTVHSIEWRAFAGCISLQTIYLRNYSIHIDSEIFHKCESLQHIWFEGPPHLPSKYVPFARWANWLNNGYRGNNWYDPVHDSDQYNDYSDCEVLERIMFCAPFPTIHIEHMSSNDITSMCCSGPFGLSVFTPQFIAFEEQL